MDQTKCPESEALRLRAALDEARTKLREAEQKAAEYEEGAAAINMMVDAIMAVVGRKYGEAVCNEDGSLKGYHLALEAFEAQQVMREWLVTAARAEDGGMLIGVQAREKE